jgi:hypothetical protein
VLNIQDELSGWFGSMDKYASGKGAAKDRGFWLQAYNGGSYSVDRIGRGSIYIPNLSISLLGGIQPGPLRKIIDDANDDGLIQRLIPYTMATSTLGQDKERPDSVRAYEQLVNDLYRRSGSDQLLRFSPEAQAVQRRLEQRHLEMMSCEAFNAKLAAHIGKYDGIFARLCIIWHCIERPIIGRGDQISESAALRVERFLHQFLLPHATAFYVGQLQLSDDHDRLASLAGYILARKVEVVTPREVMRGDSSMRSLTRPETNAILEQMEALGWLEPVAGSRKDSPRWKVNPECHRRFAEKGQKEAERRQSARKQLLEMFEGLQK